MATRSRRGLGLAVWALTIGAAAALLGCRLAGASSPHSTTRPARDCAYTPTGGFLDVWKDPRVGPALGCAVAPAEPVTGSEAYLCCAHSLWLAEKRLFVAIEDAGPRWSLIRDESGLPAEAPPMVEPVPRPEPCFPASGRHGWLASSAGWAAKCGGQAKGSETAFRGTMQQFEHGWLLWNGDVCFVLFSDGRWLMF